MTDGACVVLCDIDRPVLETARAALAAEFGDDIVRSVWADVTSEEASIAAFNEAALAYGGLDICVCNAGIASAAPLEDTTLALWQRNIDILATGYFLTAREAFRLMKAQALAARSSWSRARTRSSPPPAPRPIARPRQPSCIWPAAWRWKARHSAFAPMSSTRTPCCAARASGRANGASNAPPATKNLAR